MTIRRNRSIAKPRPPRKRAGPRVGSFARRLVRISDEQRRRDADVLAAALPDASEALVSELALIAQTFTSALIALPMLATAREIAAELERTAEWARNGGDEPPPWATLPLAPTTVSSVAREALTFVGPEARAATHDPTPDALARLAVAGERQAALLRQAAGKSGAHGPEGCARHPAAAMAVSDVAMAVHRHVNGDGPFRLPLRRKSDWLLDWEARPVFAAVRAVFAVSEGHLIELRRVEPERARNALLALRAARDARMSLVAVVRALNRMRPPSSSAC